MSPENERFAALRSPLAPGSGASKESLTAFLSRQPEFLGRRFTVSMDESEVKAGVSAGHIFFAVHEDGSPAPAGRYVLRFDAGEARLFRQTSLRQQFEVMRALHSRGLPTPEALWFDAAGEIVGTPALIMRRVEGIPPHILYMESGPYIEASAAGRRDMVAQLMGFCWRLHALPVGELGLDFLQRRGGERGDFIEREIAWTLEELHSRFPPTETGERAEPLCRMRRTCDEAAAWLVRNAPKDASPVLVHGDVTLANAMFSENGKLVAVLDWELCHLGLPAEDVVWPALAARASATFYRASIEAMPTLDDYRQAYLEAGGVLDHFDFAAALAAFQMVAISALAMRGMPPEFWASQADDWTAQEALLAEQVERVEAKVIA